MGDAMNDEIQKKSFDEVLVDQARRDEERVALDVQRNAMYNEEHEHWREHKVSLREGIALLTLRGSACYRAGADDITATGLVFNAFAIADAFLREREPKP
jgi:hypothetical protein